MNTPAAGDFGVVATGGWMAKAIQWVTRSKVNHAILSLGDGLIVEGDPNGAQLSHASKYPRAIWAQWPLNPVQRAEIAGWGRAHIGTPYSWIDDAEIGLVDTVGWAPGWMRRRLRSTTTLMCSQLVDAAYQAGGVHLFADGRPPGAVSPGDLYRLIQKR